MTIKIFNSSKIVDLWNAGCSAESIIQKLDLDISVRQVQRIGAAQGSWRKRQLARLDEHGNA